MSSPIPRLYRTLNIRDREEILMWVAGYMCYVLEFSMYIEVPEEVFYYVLKYGGEIDASM